MYSNNCILSWLQLLHINLFFIVVLFLRALISKSFQYFINLMCWTDTWFSFFLQEACRVLVWLTFFNIMYLQQRIKFTVNKLSSCFEDDKGFNDVMEKKQKCSEDTNPGWLIITKEFVAELSLRNLIFIFLILRNGFSQKLWEWHFDVKEIYHY